MILKIILLYAYCFIPFLLAIFLVCLTSILYIPDTKRLPSERQHLQTFQK